MVSRNPQKHLHDFVWLIKNLRKGSNYTGRFDCNKSSVIFIFTIEYVFFHNKGWFKAPLIDSTRHHNHILATF